MNQAIEQAIIEHTNQVWEQAHKVGVADERERIIKLLYTQGHWSLVFVDEDLIAIIKGDTE